MKSDAQMQDGGAVASKDGLGDNDRGANLKRSDQIKLLKICEKYTDTGEQQGTFTYPNCGWDLVQMGLATENTKITVAGRAALWLLNLSADPTKSKAVETFKLPLSPNEIS
jgi:hypothetical protein